MKFPFTGLYFRGHPRGLSLGFLLLYSLHSSQLHIGEGAMAASENIFAHPTLLVQKSLPGPSILTQEDLPTGFEPAPAFLEQFIVKAVAQSQATLEKESIIVQATSSFIDLEEAEIVTCVVLNLPNSQARGNYDRRLKSPNTRKELEESVQAGLGLLGKVTIKEFQESDSLSGLGEVAESFQFQARAEKLPVPILTEVLAFRRRGTGIVLIVSSVEHRTERIGLKDLGLILDRRLATPTVNR